MNKLITFLKVEAWVQLVGCFFLIPYGWHYYLKHGSFRILIIAVVAIIAFLVQIRFINTLEKRKNTP